MEKGSDRWGFVVAGRWLYWRHCSGLRCLSRRLECNQVCNAITQMEKQQQQRQL